METILSNCKICHSFQPHTIPQTRIQIHKLNTKPPQIHKKRACVLMMGCAKSGGMEAKKKMKKDSEFVMEGKCQGKKGIVELMECLESEAIMGEDQGKEASDYNRRAKIFDKSAQVFQALKEESLTDNMI